MSAGIDIELKKENDIMGKMDKYECPCGYIYDPAEGDYENGIEADTPFEALPDDWVCPKCGAEKEYFENIG